MTTIKKKKLVVKKKPNFGDYLVNNVRADFGADAMLKMSGKNRPVVKTIFSTGYDELDTAIGIGGYPKSRIIEVFGDNACGKTTLALHACAEVQKVGGVAAFIDAEHALDIEYAAKIGVNVDELLLNQPDNGEQVFDIIGNLIKGANEFEKTSFIKDPKGRKEFNNKPLLIVVDSVAAMVPKAELDGTLEDGTGAGLGRHPELMSKGLRRLVPTIKSYNVLILFINQIRMKIGVVFGSPISTPGGNALKFYASVRLQYVSSKQYEESKTIVGKEFKIKIIKNKVSPPFKTCKGIIRFGVGIDPTWNIYNILASKDNDMIERLERSQVN